MFVYQWSAHHFVYVIVQFSLESLDVLELINIF